MAMFSPDGGGVAAAPVQSVPEKQPLIKDWFEWFSSPEADFFRPDRITWKDWYNQKYSAPPSAADQTDPTVPDDINLYYYNMEREKEAAQAQMDFQTNANKGAMDFSADQAQITRDWYEKMMHDAYSIEVESLKKAGLNPALAYSHGAMSIPGVSSASGVTSAGSKASYSDTGYKYYDLVMDQKRLNYAYTQMVVNAASQIASSVIKKL